MKSISQILEFFGNIEKLSCHPELVSGSHNNLQIKSLYLDSRKCDEKSAFIALKGSSSDGNDYIESVLAKGVKLVLSDERFPHSPLERVPIGGCGCFSVNAFIRQSRFRIGVRNDNRNIYRKP